MYLSLCKEEKGKTRQYCGERYKSLQQDENKKLVEYTQKYNKRRKNA